MVARIPPQAVEPLSSFGQRDLLVPEGLEVKRALFLPENIVCLILNSEALQFVKISDRPQLIGFQYPSISGELIVIGNRLLMVGVRRFIQFIEPKMIGPIIEMPFRIEYVRAIEDKMFFVANECVVYFCKQNDPTSVHELIVVSERICAMEIGESFDSIVLVTIDNVLRVYGINGEITALVNVNGEPDKVIVTNGWGFIVVAIGQELSVYTINGDPIGQRKLGADIREWMVFSDYRLFDFLICVDEENQIGLVEVGRVEQNGVFINGREADILAVRWMEERSCVATVTRDGVLALYPMSIE
jgi:hypothetical protein